MGRERQIFYLEIKILRKRIRVYEYGDGRPFFDSWLAVVATTISSYPTLRDLGYRLCWMLWHGESNGIDQHI